MGIRETQEKINDLLVYVKRYLDEIGRESSLFPPYDPENGLEVEDYFCTSMDGFGKSDEIPVYPTKMPVQLYDEMINFISTTGVSIEEAFDHPDWETKYREALDKLHDEKGPIEEDPYNGWLMIVEGIPPDTYVAFWESERGHGFEDPEETIISFLEDELLEWDEIDEAQIDELVAMFRNYLK